MPDIVHVEYKQTGQSKSTNLYGMREIQEKAFEASDALYLLLKAPLFEAQKNLKRITKRNKGQEKK